MSEAVKIEKMPTNSFMGNKIGLPIFLFAYAKFALASFIYGKQDKPDDSPIFLAIRGSRRTARLGQAQLR